MEDQEAVLKRNLTKLLKDLEQGTVSKAVPEINDAMESNNVCPFSHVEGAGDNSKKKEDIVKKSSVEPNEEKPTKKEVDIASTTTVSIEKTVQDTRSSVVAIEKLTKKEADIVPTAVISNEKTVKDTGSTVVATEKDIPALELVVTVEECITKNPGPSNIMDGSKVFTQIDETINEDGIETNTGMDVERSVNLNPNVHPTTATGINQSNGINTDLSNAEGSDIAIPGPSTLGDGINPNGTAVAPDSVVTLVGGATPDPKIVASGKSGPKDKKMAQTK